MSLCKAGGFVSCRILNFWGLHRTWGRCAITSGLNFFISKFNFIFPSLPLHCVCLAEVTEPKAFFLPGFICSRLRGEWIVCEAEDKRPAGTLGCFSFSVLICQTIGEGKASCTTWSHCLGSIKRNPRVCLTHFQKLLFQGIFSLFFLIFFPLDDQFELHSSEIYFAFCSISIPQYLSCHHISSSSALSIFSFLTFPLGMVPEGFYQLCCAFPSTGVPRLSCRTNPILGLAGITPDSSCKESWSWGFFLFLNQTIWKSGS